MVRLIVLLLPEEMDVVAGRSKFDDDNVLVPSESVASKIEKLNVKDLFSLLVMTKSVVELNPEIMLSSHLSSSLIVASTL